MEDWIIFSQKWQLSTALVIYGGITGWTQTLVSIKHRNQPVSAHPQAHTLSHAQWVTQFRDHPRNFLMLIARGSPANIH